MSRWEVQKSLWPYLDKLEKLGIFGSNREEVVNTLLSMQIATLIGENVISARSKKRKTYWWFPRLNKKR